MNTKNTSTFDLLFLGTSACEFGERLKTDLKDRFDKNVRRSSALLVNSSYLIDCGVHTIESLCISATPTESISNVFITHFHKDHYNREHIAAIAKSRTEPLRLWVRSDAEIEDIENVEIIRMTPFEKYDVDGELYITGLPANHDPNAFPQHFILERNGKKMFYGCDGGWFLNRSYLFLKNAKLSLAVLDCTTGDYLGDFRMGEHNSIPMIRLMLPSLKTIKAIDDETKIFLSHLAPSLHKSHEETVLIAKEIGADVAYDGLRFSI